MTLIHKILFGIEIYLIAAASLIVFAFLFAQARRVIFGKSIKDYPFTAADVQKAQLQASKEGRIHRLLVAFDIFLNILIFNGQQDETMSAHAYRASQEGKLWGKLMNHWLDWFQADHGAQAASGDLERAEERISVEKKTLDIE